MITFAGDITQDSSENNERKLETGNADLPATGRTGQLRRHPDEYNLLTVAWTGTVCTNPRCATSRSARAALLRHHPPHG